MKRKLIVLLLTAVITLILSACTKAPPPPAPDLTGDWTQRSDGDWYHIATITDDTIEVWWYLPSEDLRELYWSGTFEAPATGEEPYSWTSLNHYTAEELGILRKYRRTSREETKTFTYKDGQISYIVTAGHLQMTFVLKKNS